MSNAKRRRRWLLSSFGQEGDPLEFLALGRELMSRGETRLAATAFDRVAALAPEDAAVIAERGALLDQLAIVEHGITFRYVPAGSFLMGDAAGDTDERPEHVVELEDYWLSDTPLSWATYCDVMGWEPPPSGKPKNHEELAARNQGLMLVKQNMICLQYCEDETLRAHDWHRHIPPAAGGQLNSMFSPPERADPTKPWGYSVKPMVGVSWSEAEEVGAVLSEERATYRLPTEAEWEKAARGGLIGSRFPWGAEPPSPDRCDYARFEQLVIQPMRRFPPNGYGLYAMSGGVWEWTRDWYDARFYAESPPVNPLGPAEGAEKVIRGGSWADCAETLRVSFRASRLPSTAWDQPNATSLTPNVGFRLCRVEPRRS